MSASRWAVIAASLCALANVRAGDDLKINSGGKVIVRSKATLNSGQVIVGAGGELELTGGAVANGSVQVQANGLLSGTGIIGGNLTSDGTIALDTSLGILQVTGDVLLSSSGTLKLSIGGLTSTGFSCLTANGTFTLGGTLALALSNGFYDSILNANSFTLLALSSSTTGAFTNVSNGQRLDTVDGLGSFRINHGANVLIVDSFIGPAPVSTLLYTSGDSVSGEPATTSLSAFGIPSLDSAADAAFSARLKTDAGSSGAVLMGTPLMVAARRGDPALGPDGPVFANFGDPMINAAGQLAFKATIKGMGVTSGNNSGIWTNVGGTLVPAVRKSDSAAGVADAKIKSVISAGLSDAGRIPYIATLGGKGVSPSTSRGLWLWQPGGTTLLLQQGTTVTFGSEPERKVISFSTLAAVPRSPGHGRSAVADVVVARVRFSDGLTGIAELSPNSRLLVAKSGDPAGNAPAGVTFASFGVPALNSNGDLAFAAKLTHGSGDVTKTNDRAIFADTNTTDTALIARTGQMAPGTGSSEFASFSEPVYNAGRNVAFVATLNSRETGIWRTEAGVLRLVARRGDHPEGTPADCKWDGFISLALPDGNGTVFIARMRLGFGGVTRKNNTGLWAEDRFGVLHLIARTGETVIVNSAEKTISSLTCISSVTGTPDHARSYNETRQLTYKAAFTDRTQAIFRVDFP